MNILHAPLKELAWFDSAREELKRKGRVLAGGCADAAKPHLVSALCEGIASPLILTWSDRRARELAEEYRIYDREVLVYPAKDLIFYEADINGKESSTERLRVLKRITSGDKVCVITTIDTLLADCLPTKVLEDNCIYIRKGGILDIDAVAIQLTAMGY